MWYSSSQLWGQELHVPPTGASQAPWTSLLDGEVQTSRFVRQVSVPICVPGLRATVVLMVSSTIQSKFLLTLAIIFVGLDGLPRPTRHFWGITVTIGQGSIKWYPCGSSEFHTYSLLFPLCNSIPASFWGWRLIYPAMIVIPFLASWSRGTKSRKCTGSSYNL